MPNAAIRYCPLLVAVVGIFLLSSCTADLPNAEPKIAATAETDIAVTEPETGLTFGIIYPMSHPFYEMITEHALEAAEKANVRLIAKAPDEANLEQQIRTLESMVRQRLDGIAIVPIDSKALEPYINSAVEAGIPVLCFESDAPDSKRFAYLGGDNYEAGLRMGETLANLLNGKGMVLAETGMTRMQSMERRLKGFLDYLIAHTEIDVLEVSTHEGSDEQALQELERMIENHPHFDAFIALDFVSQDNAVFVWKAKGLNRYSLTFGMMPSVEEAIRNGQLTAAVSQGEEQWGSMIVEQLQKAHEGESDQTWVNTGIESIDADRLSTKTNAHASFP